MKSLLVAITLFASANANAIYNPSWERPIMSAEMTVSEGQYGFEKVDSMTLTTLKYDGFANITGLNVSYLAEGQKVEYKLVLTSIETIECESKQYIFNLADSNEIDRDLGARVSVVLVDHKTRVCRDFRPYQWEAQIQQGYGFCGTMDATAELYGNPAGVITIQ